MNRGREAARRDLDKLSFESRQPLDDEIRSGIRCTPGGTVGDASGDMAMIANGHFRQPCNPGYAPRESKASRQRGQSAIS